MVATFTKHPKTLFQPKKIILWETPQTLQKYIFIPTTSQTAL
jgi:hypothetical protein